MKQMAKLAQAIVHGPELVVLDEPTNGLDPASRRRMLKLVTDMKVEQGMNVLVCSHLLRDIEQVCDEAVILKDGGIVHHCNLEEERRSNDRSSSWRSPATIGICERRSRKSAPTVCQKAQGAGASSCRRGSKWKRSGNWRSGRTCWCANSITAATHWKRFS